MKHANQIDRRKALTVVAAAPVAVALAAAPTIANAGEDSALMELWHRFIAAEVHFGRAVHADDEAGFAARQEVEALPPLSDKRSHRAKVGWINRKHQVRKAEAEAEAASEVCRVMRYEIAAVPVTGALSVALKLGVQVFDNVFEETPDAPDPRGGFDELGEAATLSV
jgi:hypothetical protein